MLEGVHSGTQFWNCRIVLANSMSDIAIFHQLPAQEASKCSAFIDLSGH